MRVNFSGVRRLKLRTIGSLTAIVCAANALHYGWNPSATAGNDLWRWATAAALVGLYGIGYKHVVHEAIQTFADVMFWAIPTVVLCFLTVPYDSTDVFLYMDAGRLQTHYRLDPYSHVLREVPNLAGDPIIRSDVMRTNKNPWLDFPFIYGFFFAELTWAVAWIGHELG